MADERVYVAWDNSGTHQDEEGEAALRRGGRVQRRLDAQRAALAAP